MSKLTVEKWTCDLCGTVEFPEDGKMPETWIEVQKRTWYRDDHTHIDIFHLCEKCYDSVRHTKRETNGSAKSGHTGN
jgi:Fe2+ or Zn2+ uptake regulation protein